MAKGKKAVWDYPTPDEQRCGCKVSWYTYRDKKMAMKASKIAVKEAVKLSNQGYDFGYCSPGYISTLENGSYEVVIP